MSISNQDVANPIYTYPASYHRLGLRNRQQIEVELPTNSGVDRSLVKIIIGDATVNISRSVHSLGVQSILKRLCEDHTLIAVDPNMLGGQPYIKGYRLSVGDVLAKLYIHGNLQKVQESYPELSSDHIKEAIAFAQDFLEEMSVES